MPFWALPEYNIPTGISTELLLFGFFPFLVGLGWFWVFGVDFLTGKFSSPAAAPHCCCSPRTEIFQPPQGGTTWSSPGATLKLLFAEPFSPRSAFWLWHCWGKEICLGISRYKPEITWEFPLGILVTGAGCCIHICVINIQISWILE